MISIDYCKALDMVDRVILQDKLCAYGLDNTSLTWFQSYLSAGVNSYPWVIRNLLRLLFRSIMGPLLFVLFFNDLLLHVSSANTDLYAEDMTLSCSVNWMHIDRLQISFNAAVYETVHWDTSNKLPLNEFLLSVANVFSTEFLITLLVLLMDHNLKTYNVLSS